MEQFHQSAAALNTAMHTSLEQDMLLGDREYIVRGIERVAQGDWVNNVTIFSANKAHYASAGEGRVSHNADIRVNVAEALETGNEMTLIIDEEGMRELHTIAPIFNEPACYGCHSSDEEILGVIDIGLDMAALDNQIQWQNTLIALFAVLAFMAMAGGLSFLVQRVVLRRLSNLSFSALDISRGMYSTRVNDVSRDEIGILGSSFNEMAEKIEERTRDLEDSRRELALWNVELNDRVQQRTRELSAFSEIAKAVSHTLELDTILDDVLEKTVVIMEAEGGAIYLLDEIGSKLAVAARRGELGEAPDNLQILDPHTEVFSQIIASG
ncbi:MAG: HAMP domain-containing protein, partial [Chloroflexota bacterium]|nr:HAMP domain-containing protein [Chloroflexota bacterium]